MIPFSGEIDFKGNAKPGKSLTVQKITGNVFEFINISSNKYILA